MRAGVIPVSVCERCDDLWGGRELTSQAAGGA
jgi:hypothetical protein